MEGQPCLIQGLIDQFVQLSGLLLKTMEPLLSIYPNEQTTTPKQDNSFDKLRTFGNTNK
jgi:hypothetical protein